MSAEIPSNSGTPIFDYNKVPLDKSQSVFKGFGMKELFDAMQGFMQKMTLPAIAQSIQMPSVLNGKMPGIVSSKGQGK